jgi:predicted HicB family RNase H-like nuclease
MDYTRVEEWLDNKDKEIRERRERVSGKFTWTTDARRIRALKLAAYEAGMTASQYLAMALDAYLDERSDAPKAELPEDATFIF